MSEMNRAFKGIWIPKEIWLNKDLSVMEKIFLVEIDSLDNEDGCFASNKYFADFFDISKGRCSQIIKGLHEKNLIQIDYLYEGKEVKRRTIKVVNKFNRVVSKLNTPIKNTKDPYLENAKENNTVFNNTHINNTEEKDDDKYVNEVRNVINFYEQNGFGQSSPYFFESVQKWMEEGFESQVIIKALKIAVESNRRDIKYLNGIFKNWRARNTKTLASVEAEEKSWNSRKQNSNKTKGIPNPHVYDDDLPF